MIHLLATVALGPLLVVQGRAVRRRVPRLPEPPGDRAGEAGDGPPLRLLIAGDSSAAGVGAAHQDEALLGRTVERLARTHRVRWRLEARTGARTGDAIVRLRALPAEPFDVAVTALGVNDAKALHTRARWRRDQRALRALLRERFGVRRIVVSGLPPVRHFPALPQPLRWYLGRRTVEFDRDLRRDVAAEPDCAFVGIDFVPDPSWSATDGFHPGPPVYEVWGERVAEVARAAV